MNVLLQKKTSKISSELFSQNSKRDESTSRSTELKEQKLRQIQMKVCLKMLERDFELLERKLTFSNLFYGQNLFSHEEDELLCLEHTIELAFQKEKNEFAIVHFEHLLEAATQLALFKGQSPNKEFCNSKVKARYLVKLIFASSEFKNELEGLKYFLRELTNYFPNLDMPWASKFLKEASKENWMYL